MGRRMKFAYADPPYLGMGKRMYGDMHPEAEKWDSKHAHIDLIREMCGQYPDGWAYSCNPADLKWLLHQVPDDVRVAAWVKTFHQIRPTTVQYAWEAVLWRGGRKDPKRAPMVRDWLSCARTNQTGTPGAKPAAFNYWVLDLLAFDPTQDEIIDMFPGSSGMAQVLANPRLNMTSGESA